MHNQFPDIFKALQYMLNFLAYNIIIVLTVIMASPFILPYLLVKGLLDSHFRERLGLLPTQLLSSKGKTLRIWIHAVSIGEVKLAKVIASAIKERVGEFCLVLSTTTKGGRQTALQVMPENALVMYNPIDLLWCVVRSLNKISPDLFINLETEIWPNFLWACRQLHIPAFLVNGRISLRSIGNYRRFRFFLKDVLSTYTLLSMISDSDAERIISMGAEPRKVVIGGNAKYDLLGQEAKPELSKRMAAVYNIDDDRPIFIAGSTRGGEEEIIIEAFLDLRAHYPQMLLILVPRHIERCGSIQSLLSLHKLQYCLRSTLEHDTKRCRSVDAILVDTHGELFGIYSLGTIIFCGASLVPLGGQNILEAAIWGKPVMYGPSMEHFIEARDLLERVGAGFRVKDRDELVKTATWLLENPDECDRLGNRAKKEIERNIGSAAKQVESIFRLLDEK